MKKIFYLVLALGFVLTSCEDMLDTENYTKANTSNFPASPTDVAQELAALYSVLNQIQGSDGNSQVLQAPYYNTEIMSDNCYGAGGTGDNEVKAFGHFTLYSTTQLDEQWRCLYRGIYRANTIIATIDNVPWGEDTNTRNKSLGEAYFMRAFFYLWLTQAYNDVPFVTSPNVPDPCPDASAEDVIYPQILTDLVSAIKLMENDQPFSGVADGHANKWAAKALLARAYMFYEGFYKKHLDLASASPEPVALVAQEGINEGQVLTKQDVITHLEDCMGGKSGYDLVEDYRNLWNYTNRLTAKDYEYVKEATDAEGNPVKLEWAGNGNKEEMFQIQYMNASNWNMPDGMKYSMAFSNQSALFCGLRCGSDASGNGNGGEKTFPFGQGWGQGVASANLWNDWTAEEVKTEQVDVRKKASILDCQAELENYAFVTDCTEDAGYAIKKLLPVTCMASEDGSKANTWENETWWCFLPEYSGSSNGNPMQGSHFADTYLIRYADVLLMHSELTGDPSGMNQVRARAGLKDLPYSLENIQKERRWEFAFEGLRYNDMRRWSGKDCGKDSYVCKMLDAQTGQKINVCGQWTTMKHMTSSWSDRYTATNGFLAKPQTQIDLSNGAMKQNPGWDTPDAQYKSIY
ncbi:RagB/SusD family nutrient uptake outer membrane protein [uncultured Bacteroides sp.]|uniref:RagB/SusD family nutrient uptake outer membrane protein n=1 Tax=uncultured Bacteroides sp. TaxID=162156 RepID=UPI00261F73DD|nr:RagB/SusD family nutrient uptake outer membrane protein [uncultured Bacteroides sp.]